MPKSAPSTHTLPTPIHPTSGDSVSDAAPTFEWSAAPSAASYDLQVAASKTFDTLLFDANVGERTSLALYDVVPEDGRTYYWRVRAELPDGNTLPWSDAASFLTKTSEAARAAQRRSEKRSSSPTVHLPNEGAPVDGRSAAFHWSPVPNAQRYEVQIAKTADFDEPLTLEPGHTTHLTLYSMLPVDGSTYYWRVRALKPGMEWTDWSAPAQFVAATDEDLISYQEEQERKEIAEAKTAALSHGADEEIFSPVLTAQTSPLASLGVASTMVVSFLLTMLLIARVVM